MTTLLKMGSASENLTDALSKANSEWENGSSMMKTFEQNSSTLNSQWDIFTNTMTRAGVELGNVLLPGLTEGVKLLNHLALGAIEAGEAIYDMVGGLSEDVEDAIRGRLQASTNGSMILLGVVQAGRRSRRHAGRAVRRRLKEADAMSDLARAPGEALSSPEALNKVGDAADEAGATYADRFSELS